MGEKSILSVFKRREESSKSGETKGGTREGETRAIARGQIIQGLSGIVWTPASALSETEGFEKMNKMTQLIF